LFRSQLSSCRKRTVKLSEDHARGKIKLEVKKKKKKPDVYLDPGVLAHSLSRLPFGVSRREESCCLGTSNSSRISAVMQWWAEARDGAERSKGQG